jgi:hypothetical protein
MPTKDEILLWLTNVTNDHVPVAIAWHLLIFILLAALFAGWKPGNRMLLWMLTLLLISVAIFALLSANYFNALVFAAASGISLVIASRSSSAPIAGNKPWADIAGIIMIFYGLFYPGFLDVLFTIEYLYASPTGLIPCPTLAVLTGFALLYNNFQQRSWGFLIALMGLFYGAFGLFYLGVLFDIGLLAGALLLLVSTIFMWKP